MEEALKINFRDLGTKWIHKKNDPNNNNLLLVKKLFQSLRKGESIWLEADRKIYQKEVIKDTGSKPSLFFRSGGTSGAKKWVEHNENSIEVAVNSLLGTLNEEEISSWCCLPLNHVGGMMQIFRAIYSGGQVLFYDYRKLLEEIPYSLIENQWISLVPTQLHNLLGDQHGCKNLRHFKGIFIGGAALSENIAVKCRNQNIPIFPTYGMTETAGMVTMLTADSFHEGQQGVGKVLPHAQLEVDSSDKRISVKSGSMCLNLLKKNDWLKTPDYGQRDKSGNWFIDGRIDRFIISGGEKVNPFIIEKVLSQNEFVDECLVIGVDDQRWGQKIVCYITPQKNNSKEIMDYARRNLEPYMIPKEWNMVKQLPLNPMGKPSI